MENPKSLKGIFEKPSDCKHCVGLSCSIFVHYGCAKFGYEPPLCSEDCEGYERNVNDVT